ncbi:uncharacterized protein LOC107466865 [Arachis duranensis]|uniref:Uncharacterized protein LOC107466865 n=1 Tax=Arachis duranensis TaxID=130453 RepID=A0A6P4C2U7_ARADU|nr:uncharacterized protein LOC107466865 [Arachis duranensis]
MNTQPHMRTNEAIDFLREEFSLTAHPKMVYRAVREARERIMGNEREQYSNGFKSGCRPLIHLDGCFLKTYYGGQLLTAVAQDANNQFYMVAYGVARSETKESWKWFLTLLEEDLGDVQTHGWNFMSDQQKGLLPALKAVMPNAHHWNCVMHIWKNFINRFKDLYIREVVWDCAKYTTIPEFKEQMEKLKRINQGAWEYLSKFEPATWVKAYFSHGPKVDNLTNNMCEVFNSKIVNYRSRPILTMCEEIRCYLMRRMVKHKQLLQNVSEKLAPVQQKRLDRLIRPSNKWVAEWTGDEDRKRFEVSRKTTKVDVDLIKQTCSCNKWQLTGMPCIHAVAAIRKRHDQPEEYVHPWLCMESIHKTYAYAIQPVPSQEFWTRSEYSRPDPPIIKRPIGRPKVHNRQKDPAEPMMQQGAKLKRSFKVTCSKCGSEGHNYKICKGAPSNPNWKPKTKKSKKGGTSQSLVVIPLSQSAPQDDDAPNTQSAPSSQAATPNPVTPASVADQPQPRRVTRGTPFRPPLQVPSTPHQTFQPKTSKIRPK